MNKILFSVILILLTISSAAQVNRVGINNEKPQAALDIKSANNDSDKVLRVSTELAGSNNNESVFFVGKRIQNQNGDVYDLRKMTQEELGDKINSHIPSLNTITLVNSSEQTFTDGNKNVGVKLDKQVIKTNTGMFFFVKRHNAIEITQAGEYNISAFVGFKEIKDHEGDMIVSIAINRYDEATHSYPNGFKKFDNYKRNVISRSSGKKYTVSDIIGAGIGASFSFTNQFNAHDRIKLQVNKVRYGNAEGNPVIGVNAANLTLTRVSPNK